MCLKFVSRTTSSVHHQLKGEFSKPDVLPCLSWILATHGFPVGGFPLLLFPDFPWTLLTLLGRDVFVPGTCAPMTSIWHVRAMQMDQRFDVVLRQGDVGGEEVLHDRGEIDWFAS